MKMKILSSIFLICSLSTQASSLVAVYDEGFKVADLPVDSKVYTTVATKLVVPDGLVVVGYSAPNLQGKNKSYSVGTYEGLNIKSLRISDQENDPIGTQTIKVTFNPSKPSQWVDPSVCAFAFYFDPNTSQRIQKRVCATQTVDLAIKPTDFKDGTRVIFGVRAENLGNFMTLGTAEVEITKGLFSYVPGSSFTVGGSEFTANGDGSFSFSSYGLIQFDSFN